MAIRQHGRNKTGGGDGGQQRRKHGNERLTLTTERNWNMELGLQMKRDIRICDEAKFIPQLVFLVLCFMIEILKCIQKQKHKQIIADKNETEENSSGSSSCLIQTGDEKELKEKSLWNEMGMIEKLLCNEVGWKEKSLYKVGLRKKSHDKVGLKEKSRNKVALKKKSCSEVGLKEKSRNELGLKENSSSVPKTSIEKERNCIVPKRHFHFIGKNRITRHYLDNLNSRRPINENNNSVKARVYAGISFLSKVIGPKHTRYKHMLKNENLQLSSNNQSQHFISQPSHDFYVSHWNGLTKKKNTCDILLHPRPFVPGNHLLNPVVYQVTHDDVHKLMRYEILRIRSYNKDSPMPVYSVTQLAQDGFYHSSQENGKVICFNCKKGYPNFLAGKNLDDTAHGEHCRAGRLAKNIPLLSGTGGLSLDDLTTFNKFYGTKTGIPEEHTDENMVYWMYTSATSVPPIKYSLDTSTILDLKAAAYPLFANRKTRRETFHSWDPTHNQKPDELVNLGFFYAGYSDCARCFYCGLGLKYWRPNDDAAFQHARFRPQCKYNQFVKGQEFVDHVQRSIAAENQGGSASGDAVGVPNMEQLMRSDAVRQVLRDGWTKQQVEAAVVKLVHDLGEECLIYDILLEILENIRKETSGAEGIQGDSTDATNQEEREGHDGELNSSDIAGDIEVRGQTQIDMDNANKNSVASATGTVVTLEPDVVLRLLEREHNYLKKRLHCQVCGKNKIGCIYLPCGHVVACQTCGDLASTCILCQKVISALANIYLS